MRKLKQDGIYPSDEADLSEEDAGFDPLKDDDLLGKIDMSNFEDEDEGEEF